jgi:cytochrome b6-f complex iron-sulfur subunit
MIGGGAAALGAAAAMPLAKYAGNLRREPPPAFVEIARADCALPPGTAKMMMYGRIPMLLLQPREPSQELRILVATCTHLNCTVSYQPDKNRIFCACHEGVFDIQGKVLAGPPPAPLREFFHCWRHDKLIVALEKANLEKAT